MLNPWILRRYLTVVCVLLACAVPLRALAQDRPAAIDAADDPGARRIRVFVDCTTYGCDDAFFVTHLTFVDHVRDRKVADVHVLVTRLANGAGGSAFTLEFLGLGPFAGVQDTLTFSTPPEAARDLVRAGLLRRIKLGLMRYVAHSAEIDTVTIEGAPAPVAGPKPEPVVTDPWDHWVLRVTFNGGMNGESLAKSESVASGVSANRVTEAWKFKLWSSGSYRENTYHMADGSIYTAVSRDYNGGAQAVKSLGRHWSAGARAAASSSTYVNVRSAFAVAPAVEYDFFPYSESTRRMLTLQYAIGVTAQRYFEMTMYGKTEETFPTHSLNLRLDARQPWGQVSAGAAASQFFTLPGKYRLDAGGNLEVRVVKGLSVNVGVSASRVRDQIYLPRGAATTEEILVRQRQLATAYQFGIAVGLSYTFGSIYNSVVNPRFGGLWGF